MQMTFKLSGQIQCNSDDNDNDDDDDGEMINFTCGILVWKQHGNTCTPYTARTDVGDRTHDNFSVTILGVACYLY